MSIQDNWRWCKKCQQLTFAGNATLGPCPFDAQPHNHAGSGNYALVQNNENLPGAHNWRHCTKCHSLCYGSGASLGNCGAGGLHDHTGSGDYVMPLSWDNYMGQHNWRWCNKCQSLAFAGNGSLGICASGGLHDHTGSGDYVLAQVQDCRPLQAQMNSLENSIAAIQNSPGYIQGSDDPHPGKPDPEMLAEVKALQQQLTTKTGAYNACQSDKNKLLDVICDGTKCVSVSKVYANIAARLQGKVVGYACTVGRELTWESYGFARTSGDAPAQKFLTSTKIPVASVSKVITALAAIRILAKHGISLDSSIGGHFFNDWKLDPNTAAITFRQLLSHTSGIKHYGNISNGYDSLKTFFTQKVDLTRNTACMGPTVDVVPDAINPNNKSACYSNFNFSIFRILLPIIDGFVDDPSNRAAKLAAAYVKIVQTNVFEPVGAVGVDCKPPASGPQASAYAYSYKFPGNGHGTNWGDNRLEAGGAGWYLSIEDIAKVLGSLNRNDGRILTPPQRNDMEDSVLGWDRKTDGSYRWVEKNGGWGGTITTSMALFGPGVPAALFINSDISGEPSANASTVLYDAYMSALTPQP